MNSEVISDIYNGIEIASTQASQGSMSHLVSVYFMFVILQQLFCFENNLRNYCMVQNFGNPWYKIFDITTLMHGRELSTLVFIILA